MTRQTLGRFAIWMVIAVTDVSLAAQATSPPAPGTGPSPTVAAQSPAPTTAPSGTVAEGKSTSQSDAPPPPGSPPTGTAPSVQISAFTASRYEPGEWSYVGIHAVNGTDFDAEGLLAIYVEKDSQTQFAR